jgi:hypothetical protein
VNSHDLQRRRPVPFVTTMTDGDEETWQMPGQDWLAKRLEEDRTRLRAVAYRTLGSLGEADYAQSSSRQC